MPEVINYTFPMSMLLASLLTMGQLSGNSEITAMRSGGLSFRRIAAPILAAGFIVSLFSVVWAERWFRLPRRNTSGLSTRKSSGTPSPGPRTMC